MRDGHRIVDEEPIPPDPPVIVFDDIGPPSPAPTGWIWGSGWSGRGSRPACSVAERIESGTVWINKHLDFGPEHAFGGAKQSDLASGSPRKVWPGHPDPGGKQGTLKRGGRYRAGLSPARLPLMGPAGRSPDIST